MSNGKISCIFTIADSGVYFTNLRTRKPTSARVSFLPRAFQKKGINFVSLLIDGEHKKEKEL
jgi:hypothetical protein